MSLAPYNADHQDMARCAAACFAATYAQSTVPYVSMDTPRNVTLVYHGDRLKPKPFIHVDVQHSGTLQNLPQQWWLEAKVNNATVTFVNGETVLRFSGPTTLNWYRLAGQFDAATNNAATTGMYELQILVTASYGAGPVTTTVNTKLMVIDQDVSPVAKGWTIAGIQRLYPHGDSALITDGDGSGVYFRRSGSSFVRPVGEFSTLVLNQPDGSPGWTRRYPDSTKVVFNSAGRMIEVRDRFSSATKILYDGSNRVQKIQDPTHTGSVPREIVLAYGANGLNTITDPFSRVTTVTVNASQRLTEIKDPDNLKTTFGYDGTDRLLTITDRRGKTTTLAYDSQSAKLLAVTAPAVPIFPSGTASPIDTLKSWQKVGVPYSSTATTPATLVLTSGVIAAARDPGGHVVTFTANRWGQPVEITEPLNQITTITYSTNGQPAKVQYPKGGYDSLAYNADGLPTYSRPAGGVATSIRYPVGNKWAFPDSIWGTNQPGLFISVTGGKIDWVRVGATSTPGSGYKTNYYYETDGRVKEVRDPGNDLLSRTWYFGTNKNRSKDSLATGAVTTYGFDSYGRATSVAQTGQPTRTIAYDILNRRVSENDGVNPNPTLFAYEDSLHLTKVTDPKSQVYKVVYNAAGWPIAHIDPLNRADSLFYSLDGEVRRWKNRRNQVVDQVYDVLHRPTVNTGLADTLSYPDSTGLVMVAKNSMSTVTGYFNIRAQPDSVKTVLNGRTYWHYYAYRPNSNGLLDSLRATASAGAWFLNRKFGYVTNRGTLDSIRVGTTGWTRFKRGGDLMRDTIVLANGDEIRRTFYETHRAATISSPSTHNTTTGRLLGIDLLSRMVHQYTSDLTKRTRYGYDGLSQLKADSFLTYTPYWCDNQFPPTCYPPTTTLDSVHTFAYDAARNRTDLGGTYGTGNRLSSFNSCTYGTDLDGNVTSRTCGGTTVTFYWGPTSRLDSLKVGSAVTRFGYDALGRLVKKDQNGTIRYFLWDGNRLFAEVDNAGAKVAEYSYHPGVDNLHALIIGTNLYYAHLDGLGNVIALTNASKAVKRTYVYDTWGKLSGGTDTQPFNNADRARFKGAMWMGPEVDLYYMRNRWYEPHSGRFLSEDPVGLAGGINTYTYAGNDPVNSSDPAGLMVDLCVPKPVFDDNGEIIGLLDNCGGGGGGLPPEEPPSDPFPPANPGNPEDLGVGPGGVGRGGPPQDDEGCTSEGLEALGLIGLDALTFLGVGVPLRIAAAGVTSISIGLARQAAVSTVRAQGGYITRGGIALFVKRSALQDATPLIREGMTHLNVAGIAAVPQIPLQGTRVTRATAKRSIWDALPITGSGRALGRFLGCIGGK